MDIKAIIFSLFQDAQAKSGVQYLFALLRVGGIEAYTDDPLLTFNEEVFNSKVTPADISSAKDFWSLVTNLSRIAGGYNYNPYVFWAAESSNFIDESKKLVAKDLAATLDKIFPSSSDKITAEQTEFLNRFFAHFKSRIESFLKEPKYIKLPGFEVLELLVNDPAGLYGFRLHFSNGSDAEYIRHSKGTSATNLMPEPSGIGFMVGNTADLKQEWRIGDKELYEIGLPGRYNDPREWMPLVYPGNSDQFKDKALDATEDERIQGTLFYMFCTGHRAIEFVVKMAIKLPKKITKLPSGVELELVPQKSLIKGMPDLDNEFIYDGTLYLDDPQIETIKRGLDTIQRTIDGIAFTFSNPAKWKVKYTIKGHSPGAALPKPKDMAILTKLIEGAQSEADMTIDTAINWYKIGLLTDNKLNAFLCSHIAIEGLAVKLANGELKASKFFGLIKEDKATKKARIKDTYDEYYKNYYSTNLEKLINDAYFDCLGTITSSMKRGFIAVFGKDNPVIDEYFKGDDSINSLRGKLAHGEYSDWHYDEYMKVWGKLWRVQEIAKGFITRVLMQIPPGKKRPAWSGHSMLSM
ncbi:MAG TPA: hypothetical protein VKC54_00750, partial [Patescibacteria group bacterium]|nr:hypothetical protein [Patescibacteria group bacterium]